MKRSYEPELMDDFSIQDERIDTALKELKTINRYLGGVSTTKSALNYFVNSLNDTLSLVDIGSAASDNLLAAKIFFPSLKIISIDKSFRSLKIFPNSTIKINSDAFNIPIKDENCDVVHLSLFLHHFNEAEIKLLIEECMRICRKGVIINDLQRSYLALLGIKILTSLFSKSELVKNDAPLSVKRGFKKTDLVRLFAECGICNYVIKPKWAFRWMAVIKK
ncbi:MAG TPA: methyltransferase domain-containing protein [Ignavibacteriaceae bacterium]|nr:methyltransferase domain-containing protein [Ignavibacteriaceae bacterium]